MRKFAGRSVLIGFVVVAGMFATVGEGSTSSGGKSSGSTTAKSSSDTSKSSDTSSQSSDSSSASQTTAKAAPTTVPVRKAAGTAVTIGAGSFTGGKDVAAGLYDVTPGAGQSGNFMVDGTDSYNDILGDPSSGGVTKMRVKIVAGDRISISGLSSVSFTPVTTPFVTASGPVTLYSGTFVVGEDIGAGRYVATPGAGQSGNFMVDGTDSYNEILGDPSSGGVPNLTVTLTKGDIINISGLNQVSFTPSK